MADDILTFNTAGPIYSCGGCLTSTEKARVGDVVRILIRPDRYVDPQTFVDATITAISNNPDGSYLYTLTTIGDLPDGSYVIPPGGAFPVLVFNECDVLRIACPASGCCPINHTRDGNDLVIHNADGTTFRSVDFFLNICGGGAG